ncbi:MULTISPECIES: hypothetical protein [Hyphomicrobiales]|uniref:hypothetical protein n=1 Tax=Methylobacterium sp. CCH7-A2 TaxID=1768789 RepID=UPI0012E34DF9|nr:MULTISPECIES: hypothetical protein [Hyphomicrobiales]
MSIYVPDDMKERMDQAGELNWSGIAQAAFASAMVTNSFQKEPVMEDVIERLRASKAEYEQFETTEGSRAGREWAMKFAAYPDLKAMGEMDLDSYYGDEPLHHVVDRHLGHDGDRDESLFFDHDTRKMAGDEYVKAFVAAAAEVWQEVSEKL